MNVKRSGRRIAVAVGSLLLALLLLETSRRLEDSWAWGSNAMVDLGAALLLAVPLWWFTRSLDARVERATDVADTAMTSASAAQADVSVLESALDAMTPLEALRAELQEEQIARLKDEVSVYERWKTEGSRDALIEVLRQGTQTRLLSHQRPFRAPIWETELHLAFSLDGDGGPVVSIVDDAGRVKVTHVWTADEAPIVVMRHLDEEMKNLGEHLGPLLFDPTQSIEVGADALAHAAKARAQKLSAGSEYLQELIEFIDGWYVTERGVVSRDHGYYFIERNRLHEMDWTSHIASKGWEPVAAALRVARAIRATSKE